MNAQLRDYQQEAHDAILAAWGEAPWSKDDEPTYRSVIANLTTSAGKTVIAGSVIQGVMERGRCLFLADTDELCEQPREKFYRLFGMHTGLEKAGKSASMMMRVVVGSAQTFARPNRLARYAPDHFGYIFVDEAHRGSDRNKKITDHFASAKVCGMTATAFRAKLKDLSTYYETVAFELGLFDLIDAGYIAPLKVLTLPVEVNLTEVKQTMSTDGMDYDKTELSTTIRPVYERVAEMIKEHVPNRQILAFLPLIKSSQEFVTILQEHGISARHIDGKSEDRKQILEAFAMKKFQVLCNSSLLTTGWDCPTVDCLLNLSPTRSAGLFRQKVGRVVRLLDGLIDGVTDREERRRLIAASAKPDSLILDLLWQTSKFGLIGPSDLIATNKDEQIALELAIRKQGTAEDLQFMAAVVQADREQKLKEALEKAALRSRGLIERAKDAIEYVAILLHGKKIIGYEAAMDWEAQPMTEKQKDWLLKNGIDPTSAKNRGQVVELMNLIFRRREKGLVGHHAVAALEAREVTGAQFKTDDEAYRILGGGYPFPFGKHIGTPMELVPNHYLSWCSEQKWIRGRYPIVHTYLVSKGFSLSGSDKSWYKPSKQNPPATEMFDALP